MKKLKNNELNLKNLNQKIWLFGFVANKRKMSQITFIDLRDRWGIVQLVFKDLKEIITKESVLKVFGKVIKRKNPNLDLPTGQIEIEVLDYQILSKAQELPFIINDDLKAKEDTRLFYRYLDLRRPVMTKNIILKYNLTKYIREFLDKNDFIEIETPILSKSTPEGARDFLVKTRKKNHYFALPQSPQIYKQLLMSAGFEKYFQIAKVFRDEDLRKDRQPEFNQLDIECSFADENSIQILIEKMFVFIYKKFNFKIEIPFLKINYDEAIDKYGSDKPDLRISNQLIEATDLFKNYALKDPKEIKSIKYLHFEENITLLQINQFKKIMKKNNLKSFYWFYIDDKKNKNLNNDKLDFNFSKIIEKLNLKKGIIFFIKGNYKEVTKSLGFLRLEIAKILNLLKLQNHKFLWVINWPLLEYDEEQKKYLPLHHIFTSFHLNSLNNFEKNIKDLKAKSYDLVLNGTEIGGGSVRINDLEIQKKMFEIIGLNSTEIKEKFGFFINAFKFGMPPHAGMAFGIDRIAMFLAQQQSIREMIPFPKNANGLAIMEGAPSLIDEKDFS